MLWFNLCQSMHDDVLACVVSIVLKWHNAFHMHRGNLEIRCECMT